MWWGAKTIGGIVIIRTGVRKGLWGWYPWTFVMQYACRGGLIGIVSR